MNKFQKVSLAIAAASSMAFALLWNKDAPGGQVQFGWVDECRSGPNFDETDENDPCYKTLGGWWFGYLAGDFSTGENTHNCGEDARAQDSTRSSGESTVRAKLSTPGSATADWGSFIGPDNSSCQGPAITDIADGTSLIPGDGLELQIKIGDGVLADYQPAIAGIAVNFSTNPSGPPNVNRDMTDKGGFCLKWESDHTNEDSDNNLAVELGWDERAYDYDTWVSWIPAGNGCRDFKWAPGLTQVNDDRYNPNESGDFYQDNWHDSPQPISKAVKEMRAFKIRLKGYTAKTVNFKLVEFGYAGECCKATPVARPTLAKSNVNFELVGKVAVLSVNKSASAQIINLNGAVVHTQTLEPGAANRINLSKLSTGVYLIRVPALGYVNKIAIK